MVNASWRFIKYHHVCLKTVSELMRHALPVGLLHLAGWGIRPQK